jgi:hypothetical protein
MYHPSYHHEGHVVELANDQTAEHAAKVEHYPNIAANQGCCHHWADQCCHDFLAEVCL